MLTEIMTIFNAGLLIWTLVMCTCTLIDGVQNVYRSHQTSLVTNVDRQSIYAMMFIAGFLIFYSFNVVLPKDNFSQGAVQYITSQLFNVVVSIIIYIHNNSLVSDIMTGHKPVSHHTFFVPYI